MKTAMSEQTEAYTVTTTQAAGCAIPLPADFDELMRWANVTRRLIMAASQNRDAMLTISVITDAGGKPIRWTSPRRDSLEPCRR